MTTEQFVYWLQGFAELNTEPPTAEQWQSIRDHLALVFDKKTPDVLKRQPDYMEIYRELSKYRGDFPSIAPVITC